MPNDNLAMLKRLARRYVWWKSPEEAVCASTQIGDLPHMPLVAPTVDWPRLQNACPAALGTHPAGIWAEHLSGQEQGLHERPRREVRPFFWGQAEANADKARAKSRKSPSR